MHNMYRRGHLPDVHYVVQAQDCEQQNVCDVNVSVNVVLTCHVLVCCLSGLMDKNGKSYTPNVVRVGVNAHHSVKSVELDTLVNQKLAKAEKVCQKPAVC